LLLLTASLLLQIARVAVLALASSTDPPRVRHRFEARSIYLCSKLLSTVVDVKLYFVLFDMDVTVFDRCTSLPLFTSAIVPLHVSTTILDRRQTEAACYWDLGPCGLNVPPLPVVNGVGLSNHRHPGSALRLRALCSLIIFVLLLSTPRQVRSSRTAVCSRQMHDPFVRQARNFWLGMLQPILVKLGNLPALTSPDMPSGDTVRSLPRWFIRESWVGDLIV
jgi:hypothetical protein